MPLQFYGSTLKTYPESIHFIPPPLLPCWSKLRSSHTGLLTNVSASTLAPMTVSSKYSNQSGFKKKSKMLWPGGSGGWSVVPYAKMLQVLFPVRAHAWVVGSIPGQGAYRRQPIDVSLSHRCFCIPPSLSLKINTHICEWGLKNF